MPYDYVKIYLWWVIRVWLLIIVQIVVNYKCNNVNCSCMSCTCTVCGKINKTNGKEYLKCKFCDHETDRDVAGSRNILIKNVKLK